MDDRPSISTRDLIDQWLARLLPLLVILCVVSAVVGAVAALRVNKKPRALSQPSTVVVLKESGCSPGNNCLDDKVTLPSDQLFEFNSAQLSNDGMNRLALEASALAKEGVTQILVIGHTDSAGPKRINERLSEERAERVQRELIKQLPAAHVSAVGLGNRDPVTRAGQCTDKNGDAMRACLAPDRRVQIWFQVGRPVTTTNPPPADKKST